MSETCPHSDCLFSAARGALHGLWYGAKVRFCHALVITVLFRQGTVVEKLSLILKLTREHSTNLAIYVFFYKAVQCTITYLRGRRTPINSLLAGAIVGYKVFGNSTSVNTQIVFYLLSRVLAGSADALYSRGLLLPKSPIIQAWAFPVLATSCWAIVMYLYELKKSSLQESLQSSMDYLYSESDTRLFFQ